MTNRIRKKYDQYSARLRSRETLPWRIARRAPPISAVAVVISGLVAALADVAQYEERCDREYRRHEERHRCAQRNVVAPDRQRKGPGTKDMRLIDRAAIGQNLDDVKISEGHDQREQRRDLDDVAHHRQVDVPNFLEPVAPSMAAASCNCSGTDFRAARYMIMKNGEPTQT